MNPWFAKAVVLAATAIMIAIRAPHGQRSRSAKVAESHRGLLEIVLLVLAWIAFFLPLLWIASPWLAFADYPLRSLPYAAGILCFAIGLWLFHLSHRDLGTNWSITLELRQGHTLVTDGVYRFVRHPMYLALLLYSAGNALVLPNWVAGPACGAVLVAMVALRLQPEERMLRDRFGAAFEAYAARTKRLIPGVW